ncbi:hypothetical protein [Pelagicoccus albus]|uniref:DUF3352 domain-containing protein n=1 Tax=Pelagicoccus albus TaxID=415222 RepID=A0A7X1B8H6_9BACT|nr:hypothetical protein [Pelagicoccus albus]MBC2607299.1 hypothetical protein [Pelagicoccus albus]
MNPITLKKVSLAAAAISLSSFSLQAGSFKEMSEHLDLDGDFVGFMDFDGDGQMIGEKLNVIYQQVAEANPNVPPFPIDFPSLFETLGFGSVRSIGMSSSEVEEGLFRNLSVTLLEGEPAGLFSVYDLEPTGFRAAEFAPADATTAMSGRLDYDAIVTTAKALASQVMGPMGEGMVMQGLSQPVPGTDVTIAEIVSGLSGGMDLILSQSFENPQMPDIKAWISLKDAGALIPRLEPLLAQVQGQFVDTDHGRVADLSALLQGAPFGLYIEDPADSDDLLIYTDAAWVASFGSPSDSLKSTPEFIKVTERLPDDAAFYAYSKGVDLSQILVALESNPQAAAYVPLIENAVTSLFGGFLAPNASATYRDDDALITDSYAGFSYKGLMMALPAGIGAGVGAAAIAEKMKQPEAWEEEAWEEEDYSEESDDSDDGFYDE